MPAGQSRKQLDLRIFLVYNYCNKGKKLSSLDVAVVIVRNIRKILNVTAESYRYIAAAVLAEKAALNDYVSALHTVEAEHISLFEAEFRGDYVLRIWCRAEEYLRACLAHYQTEIGIAGIIVLRRSDEGHMLLASLLHHFAYRACFREILILDLVDKHVQSGLRIVVLVIVERSQHHIYELVAGLCIG